MGDVCESQIRVHDYFCWAARYVGVFPFLGEEHFPAKDG